MLYFLIALIIAIALASAKPEVRIDAHAQSCTSPPLTEDVFTTLRVDHYCKQSIVVADGQAVQLFVANRDTYCAQLKEDERALAQISGGVSPLINFCATPARSLTLPPGTHYIGVSRTRRPLRLSLTYENTTLGCGDDVPASLIGVPLTFKPTKKECSLILPGLSVLEIKSIRRHDKERSKNPRDCVRVRMGKRMSGLYWQFEPVCEIPANDFYEYELGCGAVVMDASSRAIERVEFVLRPMDELKSVLAPLMCSNVD